MASLSQGGLCYDGQESLKKHLIRLGSLIDGIAINHDHLRFLSDDTLGSNQRWEADSHLQKIIPLGSNHSGGAHLQQTKSLWGRTSLGELETYTHSANYRDIHTHRKL